MLVFAAVVVLRVREPSLPRVVRMGGSVRFGSSDIPVLALLGLAMSWALWVLDLGTHRAGRILPPIWLARVLVFVVMRRLQGKPLLKRFETVARRRSRSSTCASARSWCRSRRAGRSRRRCSRSPASSRRSRGDRVLGVNVVEVPLSLPLDAADRGRRRVRGRGSTS